MAIRKSADLDLKIPFAGNCAAANITVKRAGGVTTAIRPHQPPAEWPSSAESMDKKISRLAHNPTMKRAYNLSQTNSC